MADSGPGFDVPGEWFINCHDPVTVGSMGVGFGALDVDTGLPPLVVINSTPPVVMIGSTPLSGASAEYYSLQAAPLVVNAGSIIPFSSSGPTTAPESLIDMTLSSTFLLAGLDSTYLITWQVPVSEAAQVGLYCESGAVSAGNETIIGPDWIASTVVGKGTVNGQLVGRTILRVPLFPVAISLRNRLAAPITLTGNAGGADAVSRNIVIRAVRGGLPIPV